MGSAPQGVGISNRIGCMGGYLRGVGARVKLAGDVRGAVVFGGRGGGEPQPK